MTTEAIQDAAPEPEAERCNAIAPGVRFRDAATLVRCDRVPGHEGQHVHDELFLSFEWANV